MIETLIIALNEAGLPIKWAAFAEDRQIEEGQVSQLVELVDKAHERKVIAWLSEDVLLTELKIPVNQQRNLRQIVPGLLEESVATDIEQLHFAIGDKTATGNVAIAAIDNEIMSYWVEQFKSAGIKLTALLPGGLALPWREGSWIVHCEGSHCQIRVAAQSSFVFERENLALILPQAIKQWGHPRNIKCFAPTEEQQQLQFGFPTEFSEDVLEKQELLPDAPALAINLLQGDYLVKEDYSQYWNKWRFSAVLALAVIGLHLTSVTIDGYRLNKQAQSYKLEIASLFRSAFPGETRLVNPKAQMMEQINKIKSQSNASGFLSLLQQVAPIVQSMPDIKLTRIKYEHNLNTIVLDIKAKNYAGLDQLELQLEQASLTTELGSVSGRQGAYSARVVVGGGQ